MKYKIITLFIIKFYLDCLTMAIIDCLNMSDFIVEFVLTITNKNLYRIYNNEKSKNYKLKF